MDRGQDDWWYFVCNLAKLNPGWRILYSEELPLPCSRHVRLPYRSSCCHKETALLGKVREGNAISICETLVPFSGIWKVMVPRVWTKARSLDLTLTNYPQRGSSYGSFKLTLCVFCVPACYLHTSIQVWSVCLGWGHWLRIIWAFVKESFPTVNSSASVPGVLCRKWLSREGSSS